MNFLSLTYRIEKTIFIPIPILLIISGLIGWLYSQINYTVTFFTEGESGYGTQTIEGLFLAFMAILGGFAIVFIMRKKLIKILYVFYSFGIFFSIVVFSWLHSYFLNNMFFEGYLVVEIVGIMLGTIVAATALITIVFGKGNQIVKNVTILLVSIIIGTVMGVILPMGTFLTLIIIVSLFDIYSVFKGPISSIFKQEEKPSLSKYSKQIGIFEMRIGIGDLIFYSALVVFSVTYFNPILGFAAGIGILTGVKITENFLLKHQKFPGLPIPIFVALFLVLIGWILDKFVLFF
ncbi:MAG: hypothetical protein KAS95_00530 [Candidatus Heimdallarchaeota archaeon]|nr:hypothetical protein [Candidatus Heimdallarchaeota archaeon]